MTAVSMYNAVGPAGLFAIYAIIGGISLPFYFTSVHETSGQTLEELAARQRGVPDHRNQHRPHQEHGVTPFSDNPEVEVTGTMT